MTITLTILDTTTLSGTKEISVKIDNLSCNENEIGIASEIPSVVKNFILSKVNVPRGTQEKGS